MLDPKDKLIELAKRRIREEESGDGMFSMWPDPYGEILKTFVAGGNRVNDYDVAWARRGGAEMRGRLFSYGFSSETNRNSVRTR